MWWSLLLQMVLCSDTMTSQNLPLLQPLRAICPLRPIMEVPNFEYWQTDNFDIQYGIYTNSLNAWTFTDRDFGHSVAIVSLVLQNNHPFFTFFHQVCDSLFVDARSDADYFRHDVYHMRVFQYLIGKYMFITPNVKDCMAEQLEKLITLSQEALKQSYEEINKEIGVGSCLLQLIARPHVIRIYHHLTIAQQQNRIRPYPLKDIFAAFYNEISSLGYHCASSQSCSRIMTKNQYNNLLALIDHDYNYL